MPVRRSAPRCVRHEVCPRLRCEGEAGADLPALGVTDVNSAGGSGDLDARVAVAAAAVTALEPRQRGAVAGGGVAAHVSPSICSMNARDSRGVSAWARIML